MFLSSTRIRSVALPAAHQACCDKDGGLYFRARVERNDGGRSGIEQSRSGDYCHFVAASSERHNEGYYKPTSLENETTEQRPPLGQSLPNIKTPPERDLLIVRSVSVPDNCIVYCSRGSAPICPIQG